jgi:uridine phosphorylase
MPSRRSSSTTSHHSPDPPGAATTPPILRNKAPDRPSVFVPENLLREARRQKGVAPGALPEIALLDPDGDILRYLTAQGRVAKSPHWACYHTDLHVFSWKGREVGLIANAVGAAFAVLLAEQLFASGCRLLLSVTSAGQIAARLDLPCFVLIDRALRDEGTSYHYMAAADFSAADAPALARLEGAFDALPFRVTKGATWTTDAPYRETEAAIAAAAAAGILAVEMEAAALYAFAAARARPVICFAHVTNQMAQDEGDFEKGAFAGACDALDLAVTAADALLAR